MTADKIRKLPLSAMDMNREPLNMEVCFLREIAAQLAELNDSLKIIVTVITHPMQEVDHQNILDKLDSRFLEKHP